MKKALIVFTVLIFVFATLCFVFAGKETRTTVGCGTPASTTPADWAKKDVETAFRFGILENGKTYYYGSFINREEFCEIIFNLIDSIDTFNSNIRQEKTIITDTDSIAVYELTTTGVISGKSEVKSGNTVKIAFAPNDLLTRQEAATIIKRVLDRCPNISFTEIYFEYDDENNISPWAKNAVQALSNAGIMNGYSNSVFYPKSAISLEEAVVIAVRTYNYIYHEQEVYKNSEIPTDLDFGDKINHHMPKDENYMFSPLSIKMALSLAANGADGETKQEILNAVGIENLDEYNKYSKKLIEQYSKTDKLQINVANSIWLNKSNADGTFSDEYKSAVSEFYNASVKEVTNNNAVKEINNWVNKKTNGKIPTIRNDSDFWVTLINAVYFKGLWQDDFSEYLTKNDTFNNADGSTTQTPFMNKTSWLQYFENKNTKIITLPYKNRFYIDKGNGDYELENYSEINANMHFILADESVNVEAEIKNIKSERKYIKLSLPKFKLNYSITLNDILRNIGISKAFSSKDANFKNMFTGSNLWIDSVIHKTYISVDEKGTEAAAVTEIGMAGSSLPPEPIEVKFDKPFYFAIEANGEILFMGRHAYAE